MTRVYSGYVSPSWTSVRCVCEDESGLCNDMGFLAHLPELCDITFLVGEDKEPVCAVRAILGTSHSLSV